MCVLSDFRTFPFPFLVDRLFTWRSHLTTSLSLSLPLLSGAYQCRALLVTLSVFLFLLDAPTIVFSPPTRLSFPLDFHHNPTFFSLGPLHNPSFLISIILFLIPSAITYISILFFCFHVFSDVLFPCRLMIHFPQLMFEMREALVVIGSVLLGCIFC